MSDSELARAENEAALHTRWQQRASTGFGEQLAAGLQPYGYEYKPGMGPSGPQIGPMAQKMAAQPATAQAVYREPQTGMLALDQQQLAKLNAAGVGYLASRLSEQDAKLKSLARVVGNLARVVGKR